MSWKKPLPWREGRGGKISIALPSFASPRAHGRVVLGDGSRLSRAHHCPDAGAVEKSHRRRDHFDLWSNGSFPQLSAFGVLMFLILIVLVSVGQTVGKRFGVQEQV